jgi:3alpha(or 20beta)-hydroxysteroid dehydrogenase
MEEDMSQSGELAGKVAIITGGGQGMGAAAVRLFAAQGASVVLTDIDDSAAAVAQETDGEVAFIKHDVTDQAGWSKVVEETKARFGRLDILVNNAGLFQPGTLQDTKAETMDLFYRVNQLGVFLGMQAVVEPMTAAGGGTIVNMSSCVGLRGVPGQFAYSASKWAVRGMTKCAALDLAPQRIRVNSIHPGPIETRMMDPFNEEQRAAVREMIPFKRYGKPTEVADLMLFLASDRSSYITGAEVNIDGGVFA